MTQIDHKPKCCASRHIARVAFLLTRAERHLSAASNSAPNHYHREQLNGLTHDLRDIALPLARISSALESGCDQ
jgi:hypothetical protein